MNHNYNHLSTCSSYAAAHVVMFKMFREFAYVSANYGLSCTDMQRFYLPPLTSPSIDITNKSEIKAIYLVFHPVSLLFRSSALNKTWQKIDYVIV